MEEDLELMKCGNCGHAEHKIYKKSGRDDKLYIECACGSTSIIKINTRLDIAFGENSNGCLCVF